MLEVTPNTPETSTSISAATIFFRMASSKSGSKEAD
jgi:hypothetical protein